jgi:hypothetical protein
MNARRKIIYDLGSNNGDDIPYYLLKSDLVIAVEANPALSEHIKSRFADAIAAGTLIVENCVISTGDGGDKAPFWIHKTNDVLSQCLRPDPSAINDYEEVLLPARSVVGLIERYGDPLYIKIDVEHYDAAILEELFCKGIRPPYISAEAHSIEVFSLLVALGKYTSFKLVDGKSVSTKYGACEIATVAGPRRYSFPHHSAGPFANDIGGPWMSADHLFAVLGSVGLGWKDIHASRVDAPAQSHATRRKVPESGICFVTVCKGRLHHLKETLPRLVAQVPDEIVVVDYDCPQRAGDWVEANFPNVKVIRVTDDPWFCLARARNIGARNSTQPWICFIDADVKVAPGFLDWLQVNLSEKSFYRPEIVDKSTQRETWGTFVCPRPAFARVEGYDEIFKGWGGEDDDLYYRLNLAGFAEQFFPRDLVEAISHDDAARVVFHPVKSKDLQVMLNIFYKASKRQLLAFTGKRTELSIETRRNLDKTIRSRFATWSGTLTDPLPSITVAVRGEEWLPPPTVMKSECTFTLAVAVKRANKAGT